VPDLKLPSGNNKTNIILLSLATAIVLAILKFSVGWFTNSIAIISLAVDSFGDILSSIFNYTFMKKAQDPPDEEHPYGHGKFENFASFLQSLVLVVSAGIVIWKAIYKLMGHETVHHVGLGGGVIIVSFILSFVVGHKVERVGKKEGSSLLHLEAAHLLMDSYLYLVVFVSLILSHFGFSMFDPIASCIVAFYILWISFKMLRLSFDVLTDRSLTLEEKEQIFQIIREHYPTILGYDRFQSRRSGSRKLINFRLFICKKLSLGKAHDIIDHIEREIEKKILDTEVTIHPEPTKEECSKHEHVLESRHFSEFSE